MHTLSQTLGDWLVTSFPNDTHVGFYHGDTDSETHIETRTTRRHTELYPAGYTIVVRLHLTRGMASEVWHPLPGTVGTDHGDHTAYSHQICVFSTTLPSEYRHRILLNQNCTSPLIPEAFEFPLPKQA